MYKEIIEYLKNKKIAILGFGREGKSSYNLIRKNLPLKEITILDQNQDALKNINDNNLNLVCDNYLDKLNDFDIVIKTPGISLINKTYTTEITSQFDLLLRFTKVKLIGITGTKGKSTTSSLIYEIIKNQKENTFYVGNIGIPVFDYIEQFNENSLVVAEMSAHQLNDLHNSPHIGIILNLFPEHLDYFYTLDNYYNAKLNMFKFQNNNDYALYYDKNETLNKYVNDFNIASNKITISEDNIENEEAVLDNKKLYDFKKGQKLEGLFNKIDIIFALKVASILELDLIKAENVIRNFTTLPHRMECVGTYKEISFYDDTLATIPDATMNSVKALEKVDTLIIGGMDRKIGYDTFISDLANSNVSNIICQPDTGKYIYEKLSEMKLNKNLFYIETMEEAVQKAYEITKKGMYCLLSPSAPSYNVYKNYEEKSAKYIECIKKYGLQ